VRQHRAWCDERPAGKRRRHGRRHAGDAGHDYAGHDDAGHDHDADARRDRAGHDYAGHHDAWHDDAGYSRAAAVERVGSRAGPDDGLREKPPLRRNG
jgi:hypothetical protein